jgi:hypothetical protein
VFIDRYEGARAKDIVNTRIQKQSAPRREAVTGHHVISRSFDR